MRPSTGFLVRDYRPAELEEVKALDARVEPYRAEDAAAVKAMQRRAARAPRPTGRWGEAGSGPDTLSSIGESFLEFWVAREVAEAGEGALAGIVGGCRFEDRPEVGDLPAAAGWLARGDVAELRHLRVAPEARRRGIGRGLCQAVVSWARDEEFGLLVVNTTSAQIPARALYGSLGFRAVGMSYLDGKYEVVWHEMAL